MQATIRTAGNAVPKPLRGITSALHVVIRSVPATRRGSNPGYSSRRSPSHENEFTLSLPSVVHLDPDSASIQETMTATDVLAPDPAQPDVAAAPTPAPSPPPLPCVETTPVTGIEPPVVRFVLLAMGIIGALSVIAFAVADDIARAALSVWIPLLAAVFALPFLLYHAGKTRATLKRLGVANEAVGQAGKRLLRQSIVFALLFTITASTVGYAIGAAGAKRNTYSPT